ncbi:MAG: UDP-3-O-[3-hydroxymyristoyl] N-acetylglucosamine deacetylase [Sulfurospirillum sp.]|nr:MAG: UDP-3-O-[3-hydroxymyristoyl] N-acetylglucosamine deacetylase [Sulfurospirillum sp.]
MKQLTIKKEIKGVGIGLHKGEPVRFSMHPLDANSGILFYRTDTGTYIEATPENVVDTQMATVIGKEGSSISTIEHMLSAIYAFGIDNLLIKIDASEVPVMDGSSTSFCMMLNETGIQELSGNKKVMILNKEVEVRDGDKFVKLTPSDTQVYHFQINFTHPAIGFQEYQLEFSKQKYIDAISRARTFGFLKDVQMLRSHNLALGASLENAIVLDSNKIINNDGLRYNNEFVRHKILDAIGDLKLLGMPYIGSYSSFAGSHHLNHLLTKEILKDPENYSIEEAAGAFTDNLAKVYA